MKKFKRIIGMILVLAIGMSLFACGGGRNEETAAGKIDEMNFEKEVAKKKFEVVYFSAGDDAGIVAEEFATELDASLHQIMPEVPYKETDLDFNNPDSRVSKEDKISLYVDDEEEEETYETSYGAIVPTTTKKEADDKLDLPKIRDLDVSGAEIIIIGFPVQNENAPKPVYTFLKGLKNQIIIPFCTNGEFGKIDEYINNFVDKSCKVMTGKSFTTDTTVEEIKSWISMLSTDF